MNVSGRHKDKTIGIRSFANVMAKEMLKNKFSTLKSEDAAITLPLLNSPSAGNEHHPTVDAENREGSVVAAMSAAQKGLLGGPPFIVKSVMLADVKMVQVEERRGTACMNITL
eukprot:12671374-Ditylum_brightwellii.AAC.1